MKLGRHPLRDCLIESPPVRGCGLKPQKTLEPPTDAPRHPPCGGVD